MSKTLAIILVTSLVGVRPEVASARTAAMPFEKGDMVATVARAPLLVQSETVATIGRWRTLVVERTNGEWVWTSVDWESGKLSGWIHSKHLILVPDELRTYEVKSAMAGHLGSPDAVALGAALRHPGDSNSRHST